MDELFELDERMQSIIEAIGTAIESEESAPQVLNIPRCLQLMRAYQHLQLIACEDWRITCTLHEPYTSMGVISVEAPEYTFDQITGLFGVLLHASNIEIYPLVTGNLRMNITFHGITKRVCKGGRIL